jgi:hypothetical protein
VNPVESLDVIASKGRRMPVVLKDSDDKIVVFDKTSDPCPGCDRVTAEGDEITKIYWAWWHAACARKWLKEEGELESWKVIAHQMARHPHRYRAAEIRTVMEHLLAMLPQRTRW